VQKTVRTSGQPYNYCHYYFNHIHARHILPLLSRVSTYTNLIYIFIYIYIYVRVRIHILTYTYTCYNMYGHIVIPPLCITPQTRPPQTINLQSTGFLLALAHT
jgi:hypothetical protein